MSFIRALECAAFPGITNRLERDIASYIAPTCKMITQDNWNQLRTLQTELSSLRELIFEYNTLTDAINIEERTISHMAFVDPEATISTDGLNQSKQRLQTLSAKLSTIYKKEMNLTKADLEFHLVKMNAHIWTLDQLYCRDRQRSGETLAILNKFKAKRQQMETDLAFVNQKIGKD